MFSACVLLLIVAACACAPVYAERIAETDPLRPNLDGSVLIGGHAFDILQPADNRCIWGPRRSGRPGTLPTFSGQTAKGGTCSRACSTAGATRC